MDSFSGKLAVVTGGGSGMGRELVRQLAAQGCSVAACDVNADAVGQTATLARAGAHRHRREQHARPRPAAGR
jgi:NAD(P)-dependent dehydrogenase (short-subunit alcohol dehydrogenase family)